MASAQTPTPPHIEIHAICALRADASGRVGRLRVLGVADRDDQRLEVDVCVADLDRRGTKWVDDDQQASTLARVIDPQRTPIAGAGVVKFRDPQHLRRRAFLWVAEIDVLLAPAVPPLLVGPQQAPVHVRAFYVYDKEGALAATRVFELTPVIEFDAGVLLVHGIGMQRRSETLSQWSAPLLRWINAWLKGATDEIAQKLDGAPLQGWLSSLAVREHPSEVDADYVDRAAYAKALVRKTEAESVGDWRAQRGARTSRTPSTREQRSPTDAERAACEDIVCKIEQEIGASAVGGSAEFREAYVLDVGAHGFEPSSVEMHLEAMAADGYLLRSRWMLAESHWAESFWAPSFFGFGRWCLLTAPVLLVHYIALARLRANSWLRWMLSALGLSVGVVLAQLGFALLMILWLVPWERLRKFVLQIQLGLAGIVGDSYVLLQDPVQRRAIIDRVQRDLDWLVQRCRSVVVIAHSQGAWVAEQVLSNHGDTGAGKIHSFATLGSGVQTLSAIDEIARNKAVNVAGWMAIGSVAALALAGVFALSGNWPMAAVVGGAALIVFTLAAERARNAHDGRPKLLPLAAQFRDWFDFFASKDLVPYGPLLDPDNKQDHYKPKEVHNRDSYLGDHVLYWQNAEQVVGLLARQVGSAAGFKPLTELLPDDAAVLDRLGRARLSRLGFLRIARAVIAVATVALLVPEWGAWAEIGTWAFAWLQSRLGLAAAGARPELTAWLRAALVLAPFVIYKTLVNATFDAWTTAEVERLLRRSAGGPATHWAAVFVTLLVFVLSATIAFLWPMDAPVVVAGTALVAIALTWIARRVHVSCVRGTATR